MRRIKGSRPSPAMIVAGVALVVALAGTAIAGPSAIKSVLNKKEKKQTKNIANNQINALAGGLSVANARNATNATTATNATSATTATNADLLDNLDSRQLSPAAGVNRTADLTLTENFQTLTTTTITTAAAATLVGQASVHLDSDGGNDDRGDCRFNINGTAGIGYSTDVVNNDETMPVTQTQSVGAGTHTVAVECLRNLAGNIIVRNAAMSVTAHLN